MTAPESGEDDHEAVDTPSNSSLSPAIDVEGIEASFGEESVLDGVDATVEPGELVGLVGPNGAGKTTLLRTISGALTPESGTVRVASDDEERRLEDVQALSSAASSRRIAVVPQTTTLSFSFSVRQLVEMGRHPHRSRFQAPSAEDRDLVDAAMERTRTARFADRSIEDVSGGERQRILLARAIAQDAPVLLLDEPTANLDLHHAVETMTLARELVETDGAAALAAIHDLELAARFCDRILVLAGGEIVANGAPEAVLKRDVLAAAFDARIAVEPSPIDGGVTVRALDDPEIDHRVHVVGGGEPAAAAIGRLGEAGADCSLGPVPEGDRAVSTAEAFDGTTVTTVRFGGIDAATRERATELAADADVVLLAAERIGGDGDPWLDVIDATDAPVVRLTDATVGAAGPDADADSENSSGDEAPPWLGRAPTTDLDSLPGAVDAIAGKSGDSGEWRGEAESADESQESDALADATLADGGVDDGEEDGR
ncbi:ATP-binding cassette domain-containing protein [Salinarchaeum laminariae]|uniref:ATP-binding cassette domain-containing protein n=1 Tax=Salinarchaeum laminariae TaxID=869888 RepID=UPI0020BD53E2|nr:ATP-binding cassette domain-containing protein [Salinarchaeum laminariae]